MIRKKAVQTKNATFGGNWKYILFFSLDVKNYRSYRNHPSGHDRPCVHWWCCNGMMWCCTGMMVCLKNAIHEQQRRLISYLEQLCNQELLITWACDDPSHHAGMHCKFSRYKKQHLKHMQECLYPMYLAWIHSLSVKLHVDYRLALAEHRMTQELPRKQCSMSLSQSVNTYAAPAAAAAAGVQTKMLWLISRLFYLIYVCCSLPSG